MRHGILCGRVRRGAGRGAEAHADDAPAVLRGPPTRELLRAGQGGASVS
ncbi:hypothetical protein FM106_00510 [Brachybacterium faecium]|nr:hypothetical protein FM106_00510 [Brachybacterium faecium]